MKFKEETRLKSPNQNIMPLSARVGEDNILYLGGIAATELVEKFGSPLWVMCQETIEQSLKDILAGLSLYKGKATACYAGKAFLCTAIIRLIDKYKFGLDVVSQGEMETARQASFTGAIFLHGNNKSDLELRSAIERQLIVVADNREDIEKLAQFRKEASRVQDSPTEILLRIIPGIDLDTHDHIKTGHDTSKFGIPLSKIDEMISLVESYRDVGLKLIGLHAHIGSQAMDIEPFGEVIEIFADLYQKVFEKFGFHMPHLDIGGGLGIAYTASDKPAALKDWTAYISRSMHECFSEKRNLPLPHLSIEPGRCLVGTAGVTLYRVGRTKDLDKVSYLSVDGGMADNPRPITYQAKYTAAVANRMEPRPGRSKPWSIVGRYCESGDIIVEEAELDAEIGDLLAIFATGAYNFSMASNYNRTLRPTCIMVKDGRAEAIVEGETYQDLLARDKMPSWL